MNENNTSLPSTDMEQDITDASLAEKRPKGLDTRVNITVTSYRWRDHDTDGISCKAALDGIVRAGLLPDDSTKEVKRVAFESVIIKKTEKEQTIIEID